MRKSVVYFWVPTALLAFAGLANVLDVPIHGSGMAREGWLAISAVFALWSWGVAALGLPPGGRNLNGSVGKAVLLGSAVSLMWTVVWLLLPAWALLKLVSLLAFAPVMAWRWGKAGRRAHALGAWMGWALVLCLLSTWLVASPWRLGRLVKSVWPAQPDLLGTHFPWGQMMDALAAIGKTGGGFSDVPPVLTQVDDATWWLRVGADFGWLPMGVAASAVVLAWIVLTACWPVARWAID